jgi:hypothetical protein
MSYSYKALITAGLVAVAALTPAKADTLGGVLAPAQSARPGNSIVVDRLLLVEGAATNYRQFTQRRSNVIRPGTQFHMYLEPRNVASRFDGTHVRGAITIDLELHSQSGDLVGRQNGAWKLPIAIQSSRNTPLTQLYANLSFNFSPLADGRYRMILHVRDDFGGGAAQASLDIVIQNGSGPAAQAPGVPQQRPSQPQQAQPRQPVQQPPARQPVQQPPARQTTQIEVEAPVLIEAPATGYRQATRRASNTVAPNTEFYIYLEPRNMATRFDGQAIRASMTVDLELYSASGQFVGRETGAWKLPLAVQSSQDAPLERVYASLTARLPVNDGTYRMVLRVNDDFGGSSISVSLDIVVQGSGTGPITQAPQAPQEPMPMPQPETPRSINAFERMLLRN